MNDAAHSERVHKIFLDAKRLVLLHTGLEDLTLIEQVALRRISESAVDRLSRTISDWGAFPAKSEVVAQFMQEYYDVPLACQKDLAVLHGWRRFFKRKGEPENWSEYWRRRQEELHYL